MFTISYKLLLLIIIVTIIIINVNIQNFHDFSHYSFHYRSYYDMRL